MIEEKFNEEEFLRTGKLFSSSFEDPSVFAYHGTSVAYSNSIEASGFNWPYHPIDLSELRTLAESLPLTERELRDYFIKAVNEPPTRFSLTPYSYVAAKHTQGKSGGQVAGFCRMAIGLIEKPSNNLVKKLEELENSKSCVYAIDISSFNYPEMIFQNGIFFTKSKVSANLIKAKIVLPDSINIEFLNCLQEKQPPVKASLDPKANAARLNYLNY